MLFISDSVGFRNSLSVHMLPKIRTPSDDPLEMIWQKKLFPKKSFVVKCMKTFNMDFTIDAYDVELLSLIHILLTCNISAQTNKSICTQKSIKRSIAFYDLI